MATVTEHANPARPTRRAALWLLLVGAAIVIVGVLLQAFSIVAYVRGAGQTALDVHTANSVVVHFGELTVAIGAAWAWWPSWRAGGLAIAFLAVSAVQLFLIGDTDDTGGWTNGLHGLLALVLLLAAAAYAYRAASTLAASGRSERLG